MVRQRDVGAGEGTRHRRERDRSAGDGGGGRRDAGGGRRRGDVLDTAQLTLVVRVGELDDETGRRALASSAAHTLQRQQPRTRLYTDGRSLARSHLSNEITIQTAAKTGESL